MYITVLLLAAVIPPLILLRGIYRLDKIEKEPAGMIKRLLWWGVISAIPAIALEELAAILIFRSELRMDIMILIENFVGVALVEEGCKYFFLKKKTWNDPEFNYRFDAIVYAVSVSLGFAAIENIFYVVFSGLGTAVVRAFLSIPGHCIFGIYMGYYYGKARYEQTHGQAERAKSFLLLSVLIPTLLHGFYDYLLSTENETAILIFIVFVVVMDIAAWRSVRRFSREDEFIGAAGLNRRDIF